MTGARLLRPLQQLGALVAAATLAGPAPATGVDANAPRHLVRGTLQMEGSVALFRSCGAKGREYAFIDATRGEIAAAYRELAAAPGAPVYMEVRGVVLGAPGDAGRLELRAEGLERGEREGPGCRRVLGRLEALLLGSAPAWQVEIGPSGVTFASLQDRGTLIFPARTGEWPPDGQLRYEGRAADATLALALDPGRCRDALTGNLYALSARAVLNGNEYRGCAIRGRSAAPPAR